MHVTLIGGGWDEGAQPAIYEPFVHEASVVAARHSGAPRVAIVLLDEGDGVGAYGDRFVRALRLAGDVEPVVVPVPLGDPLNVAELVEMDGLLVGGGLTPGYAASLVPVRDELVRWLVERGAPYAGFSAGAAIAAADAVVGGWRHHGRPICPEDAGEDLEEVAVVAGLGLVPFTVDVGGRAHDRRTRTGDPDRRMTPTLLSYPPRYISWVLFVAIFAAPTAAPKTGPTARRQSAR